MELARERPLLHDAGSQSFVADVLVFVQCLDQDILDATDQSVGYFVFVVAFDGLVGDHLGFLPHLGQSRTNGWLPCCVVMASAAQSKKHWTSDHQNEDFSRLSQ